MPKNYKSLVANISVLIEEARKASVRSVNAVLTATYWEIGQRIVKFEQSGRLRARYGEALLEKLSQSLTKRFGRGFSVDNLENMRLFYDAYPLERISEAVPRKSKRLRKSEVMPRKINLDQLMAVFTLSWTHYVLLTKRSRDEKARVFYETEAIRGGWSSRQLERQMDSQFYERTLLSKNKAAMLKKGTMAKPEDAMTLEEEIKDPYILEFLNLKDEYSESDLEEALIHRLEDFLLELGAGFTFVARQKRLRVGNQWYRIDLLLYHRKLRCLVVIDLKIGSFTHADAGQMNLYLNYVAEKMALPEENPPVGIILCAEKDRPVVHYALGGLKNKLLALEYRLQLPDKKKLENELKKVQIEFKKLKG